MDVGVLGYRLDKGWLGQIVGQLGLGTGQASLSALQALSRAGTDEKRQLQLV